MEHLRESWSFDSNNYIPLKESEYEKYKDLEKVQENVEVNSVIKEALSLKEKTTDKLIESGLEKIIRELKEKNLDSSFKLWKIPVSRYDYKGGNGRIYPKKLWENVRDRQRDKWCGLAGLADHPKADNDPGTFKEQAVGWHDMIIGDDGIIYGIASFVGPYGHLAQEMLEHGLRCGVSTSGFGEVDKYSREVDPNTFIIERLGDLVLNPSNSVFATADCPHTPSEFMNNVHQAATIEFGKQPVRENIRSKIMAAKFDAAATPIKESAPAQSSGAQSELKESIQPSRVLSKMEEKFYRKTVEKLLQESDSIENPIARLNECMDILECFDEGLLPDLKESLEKDLLKQKEKLEALVEKVVKTEKEFGMDIETFREGAERNTAQGLLLKEQVTDYKALCEGLVERNKKLKEQNEILKEKLNDSSKFTESKILNANKEIVKTSTEIDKLRESYEAAKIEVSKLKNQVKKLSEGNNQIEKENGLLNTKLREAVEIVKSGKEKRLQESEISKTAFEQIKLLEAKIEDLSKTNKELDVAYTAQSERFDKLTESFDSYKKEVADTYNPVAHLLPNSTERVGKYLNLRENKAIEIENYWVDLKEQYGNVIDQFEDKIRGAKTLREATYNFLKLREQIDPDFAIAQPAEFNYRSRSERMKVYESQGIINPIDEYRNSSIEQKNSEFLAKLKQGGLV